MENYSFPIHPLANAEAVVAGPQYRFTVLTDRLLRYEWAHDGKFEDRASTLAINRDLPVPQYRVVDSNGDLEIITKYFHMSYDKQRFSTSGLTVSFDAKITLWGVQWRYGMDGPNLGGTARTLDEVNGRCDMGRGVLSRDGYACVDDSASMLYDGQGFVAGRRPGDRIDGYLFCYGHDYQGAIKALYQISGKQPVLPRWALGNWWSRYHRYTQDEYIGLMDQFRSHDIPLSVSVVDMDWHLTTDDRVPHAGWTGYTWDDHLFPDPVDFGQKIHSRNLKITLNDHPHNGIHHHEDAYEDMAAAIGHDTSDKRPILFDPTSPRFMNAYLGILHRRLEKVACDFWWIDWQQGPFSKVAGVDPLWLLNHFHYLDNARQTNNKALIFSRYAGPGSHRYPVGFSGDTIVTWASLAFQPEFTATASNIGYGWWSHDIGGHMGGIRDDELVTRWVQFGVFSPIMRLHSSNSNWTSKEPWLYRPECADAISNFMRLRHRMIPYLYTSNVRAATEDEPIVRPMYWAHPDNSEAYGVPNQYAFGSELFVAPIVTPRDPRTNLAAVKAWFPPSSSHFIDIFTGQVYDGNREIILHRPLQSIPVLAPQGAIIPLNAEHAPANGGANPSALEFLVVVGNSGKTSVFEDPSDDVDPSTRESSLRESTITFNQDSGRLEAHLLGPRESVKFRFLGVNEIPATLSVSMDGKTLDTTSSSVSVHVMRPTGLATSLVIELDVKKAAPQTSSHDIIITLGKHPVLRGPDVLARIKALLLDWQVEFDVKDRIWETLSDAQSSWPVKMGRLLSFGLDQCLMGPLAELVLADAKTTMT